MAGAAPQLKISQGSSQEQFAFMDPAKSLALAIPLEDIELWRGRKDVVKNPGFFAVRYMTRDDPRFSELIEAVERRHLIAGYAVTTLWLVVGYAMQLESPGLMAYGERPIKPEQVLKFWGLPLHEIDAFAPAVACLVESGWLRTVDTLDNDVRIAYVPDRARTRTIARDRTRTKSVSSRSGTCADVDGRRQTRQTRQTNDSREDAALCDGIPSVAARPQQRRTTNDDENEFFSPRSGNERTTTSECDSQEDDDWSYEVVQGQCSYPLTNTEPYRVISSGDGFWIRVPISHYKHAFAVIAHRLRDFRESIGRAAYPDPGNPLDNRQLMEAVQRATSQRRMPALLALLQITCERGQNGGYIAEAMRRKKFIDIGRS